MALIVITVQDGDDGVAVGVQAEPAPPRVVSKIPPTPAQQMAQRMLNLAQSMRNVRADDGAIIVPH